MKKITLAACMLALCAAVSNAGVITAWDFGATAPTNAGWTQFVPTKLVDGGTLASSTVNDITLTQLDYVVNVGGTSVDWSGSNTNSILTPIGPAEQDDGWDFTAGSNGTNTFQLSGLDPSQQYRIQFAGILRDTGNREAQMRVDSQTVDLFVYDSSGWRGGFSPTITFTADATGIENVEFIGTTYRGYFTSLAIEAVPEPATLGLMVFAGSLLAIIRRRLS